VFIADISLQPVFQALDGAAPSANLNAEKWNGDAF
jgi:hypothetical protein